MLISFSVHAQNAYETSGNFCESNRAWLDDLARQVLHSNERRYVIARAGNQENHYWNQRRLHHVREYYRQTFGTQFTPEQICLAESEKIAGAGQVNFYLGSKLLMTVRFKTKGDFCVDCCEWPVPQYYGRGKTDKPRKKNVVAPKTNRTSIAPERASQGVN